MIHFAYPNVAQGQFLGCGRYAVWPAAAAPPPGYHLATLTEVTNPQAVYAAAQQLAPALRTLEAPALVYEKRDRADHGYRGDSLDLAYLLATLHCVWPLRLDTGSAPGDIWCTGRITYLTGHPWLDAVAQPGFERKLEAFVREQTPDRLFLVPAANLHPHHTHFCREHGVQVRPLAALTAAGGLWQSKRVLTVAGDELPLLVTRLYLPPPAPQRHRATTRSAAEPLRRGRPRVRRGRPRERVVGPVPSGVVQHFKDRVGELRFLREQLAHEDLRLLLICGRGGMGKTALLTKFLRDLQGDFTLRAGEALYEVDSVVYVSLRQAAACSPEAIVEAIGRTLEPDAAAELQTKWQGPASLFAKLEFLFRRTLRTWHCLIVLDNLESVLDQDNHIRAEFGDFRHFVEACLEWDHGVRLVATSQSTLVLAPALEGHLGARRVELRLDEGLPEADAVALLRELDSDGRLGIRDASEALLRTLVHRCAGIPRTLETLIGTLRQRRTWTLARLLAQEETLARLLDNPARELYESLTPDEQRVMQALAVYDRPVPAAAIRSLVPRRPVEDLLDALVRNYVVTYDRDYFSLHPLDQRYAYQQIPAAEGDDARPALHTRAAAFFRTLRKPQTVWQAIDDLEPHLQEFYHLVHAGQYDHACSLLNDINDVSYVLRWGSAAHIARLRSQLRDRLVDPHLRAENWGSLGNAYLALGDLPQARASYEQALAIAREVHDRLREGRWLGNLGTVYRTVGDLPQARASYEQALVIAREMHDRLREGIWLGYLGTVYHTVGDLPQARASYEQALALAREVHDRGWEGFWLGNLGDLNSALDDLPQARASYEQALAIAREVHDRRWEGRWLGSLGQVYHTLGDVQQACGYYEQALTLAHTVRDYLWEGRWRGHLGQVYAVVGDLPQARASYEQALAIAREVHDRRWEGYWLGTLGQVYAVVGDLPQARASYEQALAIAREIGSKEHQAQCLLGLGGVHHHLGHVSEVRRAYEEALALDVPATNSLCAIQLAIFCLEQGDRAGAQDGFARGSAWCQALLEKTPTLYKVLYALALAQLGSGQPEAALTTYRQALEVCPAPGVVQLALQALGLLQRAAPPVAGVAEALALLEQAMRQAEGAVAP